MSYQLREDLHYCCVSQRIVFMDLRNDAYFMLAGELERAFRAHVAGQHIANDDLRQLLERGLLVESDAALPRTAGVSVPLPSRSVSEQAPLRCKATPGSMIEVAGLVFAIRRQLRTRCISKVLAEHVGKCRVHPAKTRVGATPGSGTRLAEAAGQYQSARRYVPVDISCLLDSLAMRRFLARRGLASHIVFGVNAEPFSAHAWLQADDLALNESVSYARMHTPILVL